MLIDITLPLTPDVLAKSNSAQTGVPTGHLGTHFDVMDRAFPLEFTQRSGLVFDVSHVRGRDIDLMDIDLSAVEADMFVAFYSGFIERVPYGNPGYFTDHPQLSHRLIDALVERGISIIAVDFSGIRRAPEHTPKDQFCADRGVFVVENLCNLNAVLSAGPRFTACTYPMSYTNVTGLPCRVIAQL